MVLHLVTHKHQICNHEWWLVNFVHRKQMHRSVKKKACELVVGELVFFFSPSFGRSVFVHVRIMQLQDAIRRHIAVVVFTDYASFSYWIEMLNRMCCYYLWMSTYMEVSTSSTYYYLVQKHRLQVEPCNRCKAIRHFSVVCKVNIPPFKINPMWAMAICLD